MIVEGQNTFHSKTVIIVAFAFVVRNAFVAVSVINFPNVF